MLKEKSCGAIVYKSDKNNPPKILLIKNRNGGHWSFPKGHKEFGESEYETALREIKEETGLTVDLKEGFRKTIFYSPKPHIKKEVVYFIAESKTDETILQEEEVSEAIWVDLEEASRLVTFDNDKKLINGAKKFIIEL